MGYTQPNPATNNTNTVFMKQIRTESPQPLRGGGKCTGWTNDDSLSACALICIQAEIKWRGAA